MIYFLQHPQTGYVKIGYTKNYKTRLRSLKLQYGSMTLLGFMPGMRAKEQEIHALFANCRQRGEMFEYVPELQSFIREHTTMSIPQETFPKPERRVRNRLVELMARKQAEEKRLINITVICNEAGVSRPTITDWLKNRPTAYRLDTVTALCHYFKCDVGDLLTIQEP